jgi:hypothetical protein
MRLADNVLSIGLNIDVTKTKAVLQSGGTQQLRIGDHNMEVADGFVYPGPYIIRDNDECIDIQRRLKLANKAYFSLLDVTICKDIHTETKVMFHKTLIRRVLTYGNETWTLSKKSQNALSIFKRKILRRIYGPVQDNGQ